jgi:UDPglucose 6-dehydrogenase
LKIVVVGTGYVGLVVGACLAETGNSVTCLDLDAEKIEGLKQNKLPIFEPGLHEIVERNQRDGRLTFTTDAATAIRGASVAFIAVGTPQDEDGSADLRHVLAVADVVGREMNREMVIVTKSTVPVGTAARVAEVVGKVSRFPFHMCSNPEFLKEGDAVEDFLRPDRVVLGVESDYARSVMTELYAPFLRTGKPIIFMDIASAELTKYAANGMLAVRISFMNEIAALCEQVGADVEMVRRGIGSDGRIGPSFLFPGPGYGGSCFPKDVKALITSARSVKAPLGILESVDQANDRQKHVLFRKTLAALDGSVSGKRIAIWGLAFKPQTDDMREAPSLTLIDELLGAGASVAAHDPAAIHEAQRRLGDTVTFATSGYDALDGADALVIVTDWNEYRHPMFEVIREKLATPVIVDGRNLYDPKRMRTLGFRYHAIGRAPA